MSKNKLKDLYPTITAEEIELYNKLEQLSYDEKFDEVIKLTEEAIKKYPRNPNFYELLGMTYTFVDKFDKAFEILFEAQKKFPYEENITLQIGNAYRDLADIENAEKYYKKSYELTPKAYKESRSNCLNELGELYYDNGFIEKAIEYWEAAIKEFPINERAHENLGTLEPESKSDLDNDLDIIPEKDDPLYDLYLFQEIQTEKYLKLHKKDDFDSTKEAEKVIGIIYKAWNEILSNETEKLETLTEQEIKDWFERIEIKF